MLKDILKAVHIMKRMRSVLLSVLLVVSTVFSFAVYAGSNEQVVFEYLTDTMRLNTAAACGAMANLERESNFNPNAEYQEKDGSISYGLCQWNGARRTALVNYCSSHGYDYTTLYGQLHYMQYELETSESSAYSSFRNVENTADGAYTAGYNWAAKYERCAHYFNGVDQYAQRANLAQSKYWPKYGKSTLIAVSFDANGGSCPVSSRRVDAGSAIGALPAPSRDDYAFSGWYTSQTGGTQVTASTTFSSDTTIYAHWSLSSVEVTYYDAAGQVWLADSVASGSDYQLNSAYPLKDGSYFCGWSYTKDAVSFDLRPNQSVKARSALHFYPVYVTSEEVLSGKEVYIYRIEDFSADGYQIEQVQSTVNCRVNASYWTEWSDYNPEEVTAGENVQVRTAPVYRYYYYLCPSCGAHEPFYGTSDCHAQIPSSAWHSTWSTLPYSQSNYKTFSYTTAKYYTTSLGDGQMWIFSSGNVSATDIGTIDATGSEEVIVTGYSFRRLVEKYDSVAQSVTAYKITPAECRHHYVGGKCTICGHADPNFLLGDLTGDGKVTSADAVLLVRSLSELEQLTDEQLLAADMNGDGKITAADSVALVRLLTELT